jgi:MGT family glycosyltransferase
MAKILFFNIPGYGHVTPSLPIVAELTRRGHSLVYFVTETFRPAVEAAGAQYRETPGVEDDYFDARSLSGSVPTSVAAALMATAQDILPALLEQARAEQPDAILFDATCPWGYIAAHALGVPNAASLALMPPAPPGVMLNLQMLRLAAPVLLHGFREGIEANRRARAVARQYGVRPLGSTELMLAPGDLSLCTTSREFVAYASKVPDSIHFVGWTIRETTSDEPLPFEGGRPLIYCSLGTLNNKQAAVFQTLIKAFTPMNADVLISTGNHFSTGSFGTLPANIVVRPWVAQTEVLKYAALFVSHGGLNSVHDSLYRGVPMLLVPQQAEQTLNGLRVVQLGAGLQLKHSQVNPESLRRAANQIIGDSHYREAAQRTGDTFRAAGGAVRAADLVEGLLHGSSDSHRAAQALPAGQ